MFRLQDTERGNYTVRELRQRYEKMLDGVAGGAIRSRDSSRGGTPGDVALPSSPTKRVIPQTMEEVCVVNGGVTYVNYLL